jgi:hypothetical protein
MDFSLKNGSRTYRMAVELVAEDAVMERYKVHARANPTKFIILQNNRPLIRGKNLKHKRIAWKVLEGEIKNRTAYDELIKILEFWIEPPTGF